MFWFDWLAADRVMVADEALMLWLRVMLLPPAKTNWRLEPLIIPLVPLVFPRLLMPKVCEPAAPPPAPPEMVIDAPAASVTWLRVILLPPTSTIFLVLGPVLPRVLPRVERPTLSIGTPILIVEPFVDKLTAPVADRLEVAGTEKLYFWPVVLAIVMAPPPADSTAVPLV